MNKGDGSAGAATADHQKMNASDQKLTQTIRKSVMADKSLSSYAHNVKIIAMNGMVTLKGPVRSDDEKKAIVAKAIGSCWQPRQGHRSTYRQIFFTQQVVDSNRRFHHVEYE